MRRLAFAFVGALLLAGCSNGAGFNILKGWLAESEEDFATAAEVFREAAERGDAMGQNSLGELYEAGNGVPQDYEKAVLWYRRAAVQGHAGGQFNLGRMYRDGKGVPQNFIEGYAWINLGARQDTIGSLRRARDALAQRLGAAQLTEAQRLSKEYFERYNGERSEQSPGESTEL